jgi:hypothetical protein
MSKNSFEVGIFAGLSIMAIVTFFMNMLIYREIKDQRDFWHQQYLITHEIRHYSVSN